jgi:hypothetical protein
MTGPNKNAVILPPFTLGGLYTSIVLAFILYLGHFNCYDGHDQ